MASQPRKRYRVTYSGYPTCTLNIIAVNYNRAKLGEENMRASIAWQYFKTLGFERPANWEWDNFSIVATGQPGRPPRHSKPTPVAQLRPIRPETYGCTCPNDCATCDQGWHHNCRYNCQYGQLVG